jgi:Protein of unknown function (DUF3105)
VAALPVLFTLTVVATAQDLGRSVPSEGRTHVAAGTPLVYEHFPPTSGPHWPSWASYGVHDTPVPPELWVHNLEHGAIVLLYRCPTPCPDLVHELASVYATFPRGKYDAVKLVISPNERIHSRLAALAWTWIDEMPELDRARLLRFYEAHVDRGPEDVP